MLLSKKSQEFIDNLNIYLLSSGKKEKEIIDIIEELTAHLLEAEQNGKRIEHITGTSPKEYMRSIAKEMENDYFGWLLYIPLILISVLAYTVISDAISGELSYTLVLLIGMPFICITMLFVYKIFFQYIGIKSLLDSKKSLIIFLLINLLTTAAFFLLLFIGNKGAPILVIDNIIGKFIIVGLALIYLIGFSLWSKTWFPLFPLVIDLPNLLVHFFPLQEETKVLLSSVLFFLIAGAIFWITLKKTKQTKES